MNALGLVIDALLVACAAWLVVRAVAGELRGLESALGFGLAALMVVVGAGAMLGAAGGLGLGGFLAVHGVVLAGLIGLRMRRCRGDWLAARALPGELWRELAVTPVERVMVLLLGAVAVAFLVLASTAQPVVFDALTYRLSRVGHWLQEGRITTIATDDARLNYMPVAPDLVMAWLMTGTNAGFRLAAVAQTFGGLLALGATIRLARLTGVGRLGALAAAALLLGLPNVVPQFTSAYTDLFTTGVLAAGYCLWLSALQRGKGSWLGGAAAGLALGAKGTVVYFAPGLVLATVWLAWRHRAGLGAWARTLGGGILAAAIFVAPLLVRNQRTYGSVFGPRDFVVLHQGVTPGVEESEEKLRLNLTSAFAQLCEPNSQPPWWRAPLRQVGEFAMGTLPPDSDPYAFQNLDRQEELKKIYAIAAPDADVASTGVLLPALAVAATVVAWRRRRTPDGELAVVWAVMLTGFVLFIHWRLQWHPYLFRFLVLGAPWLAVLGIWWLQALPRRLAVVAGIVTGATTLHGFVAGMTNTYQSGWPATMQPAQSTGYYVFAQMRAFTRTLDRPEEPVRPRTRRQCAARGVLPAGIAAPCGAGKISALKGRRVEDVVHAGEGWLIVPVAEFFGHEGRVLGRTWLFKGDERHPYSVAAWRALQPAEEPAPLLYRDQLRAAADGMRHEFLVRTWSAVTARLELSNPGSASCGYAVHSPLGDSTGELPPGARLWLEIPLSADRISPVSVTFPTPSSVAAGRIKAALAL